MPLFLSLLMVACVPKKKFDEEASQRFRAERKLAATQADVLALQASLTAEENVTAALEKRTAAIDAKNRTLEEQLKEFGEQLAALSTKNAEQTEQKAALEALLGKVQSDAELANQEAEEASKEAEQARAEAVRLSEEKARLAAEREELVEEAEQLRAEKEELEKQTAAYTDLVGQLKDEIEAGEVTITELSGKLTVNMSNAILFDSGAIKVKPAGVAALRKVADVLATVTDREIRVEGHTDNVPVSSGAPYADNWGLSALRATTVVGLLVEGGVPADNIAAVGYGEFRPAGPNETREQRAANRRTEIVLAPRLQ